MKPKYDERRSNVAFKFNLRRYIPAVRQQPVVHNPTKLAPQTRMLAKYAARRGDSFQAALAGLGAECNKYNNSVEVGAYNRA